MLPILGPIVAGISSIITGWAKTREIKAETSARIEVAKTEAEITRIQKMSNAEMDWDMLHANASSASWKDEWWTILLSLPLVLLFVPNQDVQEAISQGFTRLENAPDWYVAAVGIAIASAFGYRKMVDIMTKRRK